MQAKVNVITDNQTKEMLNEYAKCGKFKDFVDKACKMYNTSVEQECSKVTVYEYYKSVLPDGCNKER